MGGTTPIQFAQNVVQFLVGPFGISMGIAAIAAMGLAWAFNAVSMGTVGKAVGGVAVVFSASWFVNTLIMGG